MKNVINLLALVFVLSLSASSNAQDCGDVKETKLYALKFHADYCGSCKALTPSLKELDAKLEGEEVEFVVFDFTSAETKEESEKMASKLGVSKIYSNNQATGFVLLVDADSKETLAKLTRNQSVDEMYKTVKKNL